MPHNERQNSSDILNNRHVLAWCGYCATTYCSQADFSGAASKRKYTASCSSYYYDSVNCKRKMFEKSQKSELRVFAPSCCFRHVMAWSCFTVACLLRRHKLVVTAGRARMTIGKLYLKFVFRRFDKAGDTRKPRSCKKASKQVLVSLF